jgi:type I restriction enzyme R subunit
LGLHKQILEEVFFTDGKIMWRKLTARGDRIELITFLLSRTILLRGAKTINILFDLVFNKHWVMQQRERPLRFLVVMEMVLFHDRTVNDTTISRTSTDEFPSA